MEQDTALCHPASGSERARELPYIFEVDIPHRSFTRPRPDRPLVDSHVTTEAGTHNLPERFQGS